MRIKQPNKCFVPLKKLTGYPWSGKKSGGIFFQGQEIIREFCIYSGNFRIKHKVREKSGNFEITSQGKVREF